MSKLVYLKLDGNLPSQGFRVTLEIKEDDGDSLADITSILPANPELAALVNQHWSQKYRSLGMPSRNHKKRIFPALYSLVRAGNKTIFRSKSFSWRVKVKEADTRSSLKKCQESGQQLAAAMNIWLKSEQFREIDTRLREKLNDNEDIRVLIRTEDPNLHKLPWQLWDLFDNFPKAEPSLGQLNFVKLQFQKPLRKSKVKILAILGDSPDINVKEDEKILKNLSPDAEVKVLVEPKRKEITDELWEQSWDIIFFAGHGETEDGTGKIYINKDDCLTIDELWVGLRKAVDNGLQLAIFNCCDGLGLATKLDDFQMIPQMILMRELVPDVVAQEFLKYFLTEFVAGKSLYAAKREACNRLGDLEHKFPCASWLPVIWQHPTAVPLMWSDFLIESDAPVVAENLTAVPRYEKRPPVKGFSPLKSVILASAACTVAVMGARSLGVMEVLELSMFDRLMRQRESELIDNRLLVVQVTNQDVDKYDYPQTDAIIARAIDKLLQFKPAAIGLNMHRNSPKEPGRKDLIALFQKNPNLIAVCTYNARKITEPPPELLQSKLENQIGFINLPPDEARDNKGRSIRRQLLSYHPNLSNFKDSCKAPNSLSFLLAARFLENQGIRLEKNQNEEWVIGGVTFKRLASRTGGYQPLKEPKVSQVLLNYRANPKPAFKVTLQEVLSGKIDPDLVKGKIVLIGHTSEVSETEFDTPYGKMPAVWIHAHMVSQILSAVIDKRPLLWILPQWDRFQWGDAVFVWLAAVTGGLLAWRWRSPLLLTIASGAMIFVLYQVSLIILILGGWMPLVPAVLALVTTGGMLFVYDRSSQSQTKL
ncbi:CHASE2 domain-containing protein [Tychonema sp. LEGE 06208]|uniref:CHASE2 domain-containing protein n=1 Tax=Tychonema sp. LEGE 06208 TaxID=1828663 RepID=UPI00187EC450|nr:CHASE2 domain-containing protein [Tychonema sp. LEGE 06208]MBE9164429.1 CHASE2 domain-containing protein [Tychonema sp. LEGE 06208]